MTSFETIKKRCPKRKEDKCSKAKAACKEENCDYHKRLSELQSEKRR